MIAEHLAQCSVHQVGRGMVQAGCSTALLVYQGFNLIALFDFTLCNKAYMREHAAALLLRIDNPEYTGAIDADDAAVTDLATGLCIERTVFKNNNTFFTAAQDIDSFPEIRKRFRERLRPMGCGGGWR